MRLSLWQQFSSNHSGSFTVVGTFESAEKANDAAAKLHEIIQTIYRWRQQHQSPAERDNPDPTPPEAEFACQYDVEWTEAVDWSFDRPVPVLDNSVVLSSGETWSQPNPFIGILKKLGGSVYYAVEVDEPLATFSVKLNCAAPDEPTAAQLAEDITPYLSEPWEFLPPWYVDDPQLDELANEFAAEDVEALGSLHQAGKALIFDLRFFELIQGLPALIGYLRAQGCTDIEYHFEQGLEADF